MKRRKCCLGGGGEEVVRAPNESVSSSPWERPCCSVRSVPCIIFHFQCAVCSVYMQCAVCSVYYSLCSVQFAICSVKLAVTAQRICTRHQFLPGTLHATHWSWGGRGGRRWRKASRKPAWDKKHHHPLPSILELHGGEIHTLVKKYLDGFTTRILQECIFLPPYFLIALFLVVKSSGWGENEKCRARHFSRRLLSVCVTVWLVLRDMSVQIATKLYSSVPYCNIL